MEVLYVAGAILFLLLVYFIVVFVVYKNSFTNSDKTDELVLDNKDELQPFKNEINLSYQEFDSFEKEDIYIKSFDNLKLYGRFIKNIKSNKVAISFHGFNCRARKEYPLHFSFFKEGYSLLIVDQRGMGLSEGKYLCMAMNERKDCLKWIEYVLNRFNNDVEIVIEGVSMGASTVMLAAQDIKYPQVKGIIADCGFNSAYDQIKHNLSTLMKLPSFPLLNTVRLYNKLFAKYEMKETTAIDSLSKSDIPILIIHGRSDNFVPYENINIIYDKIKTNNKMRLDVDGAGHAASYVVKKDLYTQTVKKFLKSINF